MSELLPFLGDWLRGLPALWAKNRLLQASSLVVVSIVVARVVDFLIGGVVARWAKRSSSAVDDQVIGTLHQPIFTSVLVAGLALTVKVLELSPAATRWTLGGLGTVVVLSWLIAGFGLLRLLLPVLGERRRIPLLDTNTVPLFDNLGKVVLIGAGVYFLLMVWEVDPTGWLASAGIIGIAVGFAAKDTLANLFSGVFIFADSPYKVGDFINLDTGERGQVTNIGLRSTRLLTRDDVEITIPNAVIANAKIVNESGGPDARYRVRVQVGVAYGSDVDVVRQILLEVAHTHELVCDEPAPRVRFRAFGGSALDFELLCWIEEPVLRGRALDALNEQIYKRFNSAGVEIPYAKQDVYIKELPATKPADD